METRTTEQQPTHDRLVRVSLGILVGACAVAFWAAMPQAFGGPVDPQQARRVARSFLDVERNLGSQLSPLADRLVATLGADAPVGAPVAQPVKGSEGTILAYVVPLQPEGYIIVAADTDLKPVLGFSSRGHFPVEDSAQNAMLHLVQWDVAARLNAYRALDAEIAEIVATNQSSWSRLQSPPPSPPERHESRAQWGPWLTTITGSSKHWTFLPCGVAD